MAALSIQVPYPVFYDRDGQPIDNGNIYIGVANLDPVTNPLQVYYDEALTIAASQPLKTNNGYVYRNGTPAQLYVNATDFSITVNDSKNLFIYNFPSGTGFGVGAASIEYDPPFTGAVTSGYTVSDKLAQDISVKDFGAVGDGVVDDTAAIQAAVDYAMYFNTPSLPGNNVNQGARVFVPAGIYRTTDTIQLGYGVNGFNQIIFQGETSFSNDQSVTLSGIVPDFVDRPAINIQGGRGVCVRDISVVGKNLAWLYANYYTIPDRAVVSNWYGPNISAANNTRYAPYAGITIDAYSGTRPAVSYPDVNYPAWLGTVAQYDKNLSSRTTFDNVTVRGFVVGIALAPYAGPFAGSGDFTMIRDSDLSFNVVGWSISNEDARTNMLTNTRIHFCHTSIDGETYGKQEGLVHLTATGSSFDNVYQIFNVELDGGNASAQGGFGMSFNGCFGEAIMSFGVAHSTGSGATLRPLSVGFTNCKFAFVYRNNEYTPTYLLDAPNITVTMNDVALYGGYNFAQTNGNLISDNLVIDAVLDMIGNSTQADRTATSYLCGFYASNVIRARINPFQAYDFGGAGYASALRTFDGDQYKAPFYTPANPFIFRGAPMPWFIKTLKYGDATLPVSGLPALVLNRATYNLTSLVKSSSGTYRNDYTFTVSDAFVNDTYGASIDNEFAVNSGDFAIDTATGHAFYVAGITYGVGVISFRLRQLSGLRNAGTSGSPIWESTGSFSATTGSLQFYNARRYYPAFKRIVSTTTAAAATITGAIVGSEVTTDAQVPANTLFIGVSTSDYVISSPVAQGLNDSVFPYGKVSAVNSTTGIITLTQNARRSFYGDIPLFVKGAIAGTAP